jgi:uncharacterized protein YndB with AHSA1/START domain
MKQNITRMEKYATERLAGTPFSMERTYNAPIEKVWEAITNLEQMKEWYFQMDGFRPEVGFEFRFSGRGKHGEEYIHICRVLEADPKKKLSYSWTYEGLPGYSVVTFALTPEGEKTRVKLTHEGLDSFPRDNADFAKENFVEGWTHIIGKSLKEFVE